ncbi:MAG TPA: NAD(+)/NADH kinase [Candidatus Omnitrophota bacterium]|nr:NAD(+)/NADH kinase [Candidatus Omnitrophota bacterium]
MEKIGIIVNQKKKGAIELGEKLKEWLAKRDIPAKDSSSASIEELIEGSTFLICLGGDGTILSVVSRMKARVVPILGVNFGKLGFLTEAKADEVFEELNAYLHQKPLVDKRLMLSCTVKGKKNVQDRRFVALNDIVISREGLARILQLDVIISGEKFTSFRGDGLVIASPTGSTAYSLSAGGAVVHPKLEALLITPICPHALNLRALVIAADEKITVRIRTEHPNEKALLTADGQEKIEIDDSYIVEVTRFHMPLTLVKSTKRSYLETLRENFKFPDFE